MPDPAAIRARLEELRVELRAERISWGELAELQGLTKYIDPSDVELLEAAGVPEFEGDAEAEAVIDRHVQRRLANDAAYRNAENADEQSKREAEITREEEDRFYYGRVLSDQGKDTP